MHTIPNGIRIIVQHRIHPNANSITDTGKPIISHKHAVKIAPVNLKPTHNINIVKITPKNKLIIFFTPFYLPFESYLLKNNVFPLD